MLPLPLALRLPGVFVAPRPCRAVLFDQDIMHRVSPPSGRRPCASAAAAAATLVLHVGSIVSTGYWRITLV